MVLGIVFLTLSCFCCGLFFLVSELVRFSSLKDREKLSTYECGFESMEVSRCPFSLRFFLISLIFLVFDMEFVLMFSYVETVQSLIGVWGELMMMFLIFILSMGLFHEWVEGSLDWKI